MAAMVMGFSVWIASTSAATDPVWSTFRVEGEIPAGPRAICSVLRDLAAFPRWFPGIVEWRLLDPDRTDPGSTTVPVYGRQLGPGGFDDRDYVVHYRWSSAVAGGCRLEATALSDAEPRPEGSVVRIESMRTTWTASEGVDGARVVYSVEIAPGPIPEWVRPERYKTAPRALIRRLADEVAARAPP